MKKTPFRHFSNTDDARNSASAVLDSDTHAFTSGYENILDMGFLSGMDTFPDIGSLFGSDAPIPGAGSQWASNHSDEYGEVIDEPAATGTGSTETTGSSQGGEAAANTTDDVEHSEENTATDNADSTDNGDSQSNEDEYIQPGSDDAAEENEETADNRQRVPTADEIKALMSRIEQGTVTARDVAERFVTDENGNEWAVINGQWVSPDAVITGAVTLNNALFIDCDFNGAKVERKWFNYLKTQKVKNFDKIQWM